MKQKIIKGYKTVTNDLKSGRGDCQWKVGEWKKHDGVLKLCESGFHASRHPFDVLDYIQGDRLFLVEARGEILEQEDKFVAREMRLVKEIKDFKGLSVEFSIFCAKSVLSNFEKVYPNDKRPRLAIDASLKWLKHKTEKNRLAASSAAWSASSAAWSARSAAASASSAAASASSAAKSAARSAAQSAAWSARSAAWSAAKSAARSAAQSAAWSARSAAWSAAQSAAWSVRSAAWSAESAESAAWSAQRKTFLKLTLKYMRRSK